MKTPLIGIFDSGVGGLTVAQEIYNHIPEVSTIYVGDTARVPYGNRSKNTIITYSKQIVEFLLSKHVDAIVVACSTASALALPTLRRDYPHIPIYGVIEPAVNTAIFTTKNQQIGVIGTRATINSGIFESKLKEKNASVSTTSVACPLFVPLAEEGLLEGTITNTVIEHYLKPLLSTQIDTLILGCTHYPILANSIERFMGDEVTLINPGNSLTSELLANHTFNNPSNTTTHEWYVTDDPSQFANISKVFIQTNLEINPKKLNLF